MIGPLAAWASVAATAHPEVRAAATTGVGTCAHNNDIAMPAAGHGHRHPRRPTGAPYDSACRSSNPTTSPTRAGRSAGGSGCGPSTSPTGSRSDRPTSATWPTKRDVLARHPGTVLSFVQGIQEEASEVLRALMHHLTNRWPHWFTATGGTLTNHRTGETFVDRRPAATRRRRRRHPLDTAGRLVQEDLVLLVERAEGLVVGGGSVCFPNRWDLGSKLGLRLVDVHAPVSRLNDQLGGSVETFFERLRPDRSFWRLGWSVLDTGELYQPIDGTAPPIEPLPCHDGGARLGRRAAVPTRRARDVPPVPRHAVCAVHAAHLRAAARPPRHAAATTPAGWPRRCRRCPPTWPTTRRSPS